MLCITAMFFAMNVVLSMSVFSIPVPGGHLYANDVIICTASLLLGPICSFVVGGIGSFVGDALFYPAPMFVSLATHGLQAVAISLISHYAFKKHRWLSSIVAVSVGAIIMVVGYTLGRAYVYGTPEYAVLKLPFQIAQAALGAVCGVLLCEGYGLRRVYSKHAPDIDPDIDMFYGIGKRH